MEHQPPYPASYPDEVPHPGDSGNIVRTGDSIALHRRASASRIPAVVPAPKFCARPGVPPPRSVPDASLPPDSRQEVLPAATAIGRRQKQSVVITRLPSIPTTPIGSSIPSHPHCVSGPCPKMDARLRPSISLSPSLVPSLPAVPFLNAQQPNGPRVRTELPDWWMWLSIQTL